MNHVFRIIWSHVQGAWVVVSELASRRGKRSGGIERHVEVDCHQPLRGATDNAPSGPWPLRLAIALALLGLHLPARAADRYWDINGNTAGLGGTGVWSATNLFWNSSSTGTGGGVFGWNNAGLDDAFFGGTAGTVTLGSPITAHSLNFLANGYTITGNTLTLAGTNPFISTTGGNTATINSVLAGSNGLTVNGTSTSGWIMLGGTNTLTGGITVNNNARLVGSGSNSFNGAANVVTVNNGGVLQVNNANAFGGNTAAANLVVNDGGNLWLGGVSLTHNITAAGGGTININQPFANLTSTWNGNLVLTANTTLQVTNTGANGNTVFAGNLTDTGANKLSLVLNEGGGVDSSLYLDGTNSFTGGITVNAGQLFMRGTDAAAAAAGNVVTLNGGYLRVEGDAFGGDTDAAQLVLNGGTLRVETNNTLNHDVTLTGGDRYIDGLGNATWSGATVLTADTLLHLGVGGHNLTVRGPLQDTGANQLSVQTQGGNVRFNGPLSFTGDLTLASGTIWFDGGAYTYSGDTIIRNAAQLVLNSTSLSPDSNIRFEGLNNGSNTLIYGTNAEPSITMPNGAGGGELRWAGTGGFYALNNQSDVTVNLGGAGATLTWNDGLFVPDGHALILGTNATGGDARQVDFQNGIDLSGGLREVRADNGNVNDHAMISGALVGSGGLHVLGNGGLELTATNTYSGATVIGDGTAGVGHLILGSAGANSANSNIQFDGPDTINNGGMLLLTAAYGDFTESLGAGGNQIQWTGSGGFGAIGGERHVNIGGAGATLTWGAGGFVPDGQMLRFAGRFADSTVVWDNGIDLGAAARAINVNEGNNLDRDVRLQGVIQGAGGLDLMGQGDIDLFGLNTYSGTTRINGGDITSATDGMYVYFNTFTDIGTASSFGTGATIELGSHNGAMVYTGAGPASGNRNIGLSGRSGALLHLFNRGGGVLEIGGDIATTVSGASNELRVGGTFVSTDANGDGVADDPNILSGVISDGAGTTSLIGTQCAAGSVWRLGGANTFTGRFNPNGCTFEVTSIANAGDASAVGGGDLIADFRGAGGTVRYVGSGDTTDRLFWSWGNAHLESSGSGALVLTNTGLIVDRNGGFTQFLGGTNTGDNLFAPTLVNGLTPAEFHNPNNIFNLIKEGPGLWALVTDNNAHANAYAGLTRIFGGALRADDAGAITGGFGVTSSHGTTGSSERSSLIRFEGTADGTGGVLGLTAASGGFFRGTSTRGLAFIDNNGTTVGVDPDGATGPLPAYGTEALDDDNYEQGVRWIGSGGFAAWDGTQVVNLFGDARELTWGSGGFVPTSHELVFGYVTADGTVDFQNGINLGAAGRTVRVNNGTAGRDAIMSGVLRSTSALGGLTKTGDGALTLSANNTYTGTTTINAGTLELGTGGTTGNMGTGTTALVASGATLVANHSNAFNLAQAIIGDGTLVQRGTGATTMTRNSDIDHVVMEHGRLVTPGTLLTDDVTFSDDGGATLEVAGAMRTSTGDAVAITGGTGDDTVRVDPAGNLLANGTLGAGDDRLDVAGTLDTDGGSFDLADGDDTFLIHDNTDVIGTVLGGAGIDTLEANIGGTAALDVVQGFETLTKSGAGVLHLDGPGDSDFSTVDVDAGTLDVRAGAAIIATAGRTLDATVASGATLNVDGAFGCGDGNDSIDIAGNVTGTGTIDQCDGDDALTLRDGADVSGYAGVFDGGANTPGIGDTVQLDIAGTLDFAQGSVTNYENLLKSNTGTATLSGSHTYTGNTTISGGTLDVVGSLTTPVIAMTNATGTTQLNVDGSVEADGGTQALIIGSAGSNVVNVNAGATLLAIGALGGGTDRLDVAGTLDTGAGSFDLGNGNDTFVIHDDTDVVGTVIGGAGIDTLDADIAGTASLGVVQGFETLTKTGGGALHVEGPGTSDFANVNVDAGTLHVAAGAAIEAAAGGTLTTTVANGATLDVDGAYGCGTGADSLTVAGTVAGNGTIDQCGGDDTLTLDDGASLVQVNAISGGAHDVGDTVILNNALAMTLDGDDVANYEFLVKDQEGVATLTGASNFSGGTTINAGTLDVDGSLTTPTLALTNTTGTTTLNVDGLVQGTGGTQTVLDGGLGDNAIVVGATGTLLASGNLGDGSDVLDVSGVLDTGAGTLDLGDGDDTFLVHDGTLVLGTVIGGAGTDTRIFELAGTANVGALQEFEGLTKRGAGTLNITGPGVSELADVRVEEGTLDVQAAATVVAQAGNLLNTNVSLGATLNVDGSYTASSGDDVMDVSGTVSGAGTISLADGDDTLVLNDGASLTGANPIDGGAHGAGDTVALNIAGNYVFSDTQTVNFEILRKQNTGTATLTGTQNWQSVDIEGGALTSAGVLETATVAMANDTTLNVEGALLGSGSGYSTIAGSTGTNTVNIAEGALLHASGDLGDGNDVLDVAGTLDTDGGVLALGAGDDTFAVHDTTAMLGTVDGGLGNDMLDVDVGTGNLVPLGSLLGFESLGKSGEGTLQINGPSSFIDVGVSAGTLEVSAGGSVSAQNTTVGIGSTLQVDGSFAGTGGDDSMVVAGTVIGSGNIDLGAGDDSFTLQDGADISGLANAIDGGAGTDAFIADLAGSATLSGVVDFEVLTKSNTGTLNIDGPAASSFNIVHVDGGTLNVGLGGSVTAIAGGTLDTTVAAGATLNVDGSYGCGDGNDTLDVAGTVSGSGTIDLCGGEDTLTLNDGATLAAVISGGTHGAGDTVVLNNAGALSFDAANTVNFEFLQKDNIGEATLTGTTSFTGGTAVNGGALTVAGALSTPTVALADDTVLNVAGTLQGDAGGYASITGSSGTNTVNVADGALLQASGDLGGGDDVVDVAGTLDTGGGIFDLGAGDDTFVVHDSTVMLGVVDGGAGNDLLNVDVSGGNLVPLGSMLGFESLGKSGDGTLQINGPSTFIDVDLTGGRLEISGTGSVAAQNTTVGAGTTLQVDGSYTGTDGDDTMVVAGTVTGSGTIDLADGDDSFTLRDGADLSGLTSSLDGGAGIDAFIADLAGSATLGGAINFETLTKTNTGVLNVDGPAASAFTTVNVEGGTLDVGAAGSIDGVVATTVAGGATLNVDGSYLGSAGNDTMDVAGAISGSGVVGFDDGDDTLILRDGADLSGFTGVLDGGADSSGDTIVLDNASDVTFGAGSVANFEVLSKQNTGTATLVGTQDYSLRTDILGGELVVEGSLTTPEVAMGDGTSLTVDGTLEAGGGSAATIAGSTGSNTVTIVGTAIAGGDLGDGDDTLDVIGVLDTGGSFALGDGDDNFVVHDGTVVLGTVDGGAGLDTRVYDINGTADLGALVNFEGVAKTGTGTLNITGPGVTELQTVDVLGGTLNIGPGGAVAAAPGGTLETVVGAGATLNVDGSFGCGDGNDSLSVAGTVSGSGTIDLCGGEDTLTLNDGAVLATTISGGGHGSGDTVVLNNAGALSFDGSNVVNFEKLQKDNTGEATLTGTQEFAGGTTINAGALTVAGTLQTPTVAMDDDTTLNVDGTLQGSGGGYAALTGSDGTNTVNVADGALLQATGGLGDGNDVLDVAGTLDTDGGVFSLGDGDDMFVVHDTTAMTGTVDGGLGNDMLNVNVGAGNLVPLGSLLGFESLGKSGDGTLQINGPSSFIDVEVMAGTLEVSAGGSVAAQNTIVTADGTLQVDGSYTGTSGDDTMVVAGTVAGSGSVDLAAGNDSFTIQDGADLSGLATSIDGGAGTDAFIADLAGTATLGGAINFETLTKTNTGTLNIDGPAASSFSTVEVDSGTLNIGAAGSLAGVQHTIVASGSTLNVDGNYAGSADDDLMEVAGSVTGNGTISLADGNDRLLLMEGADLGSLGNALDGGAGSDTVLAQVDTTMTLGPTVNFEALYKDGAGTLVLEGNQAYALTQVGSGALEVAADAVLASQDTMVDIGATLDVQGDFTGTSGDDTFLSMGTVKGSLAFGDGNDAVHFVGGDLSGLTGIDGGSGTADVLSFSALDLQDDNLDSIANWERVELLGNTTLTSDSAIDLGGGVLAIDDTSSWIVGAGASLTGSVENAGRIDVGDNRLGISGNYAGSNGAIEISVSPGTQSAGGLDIQGDVTGTTSVVFKPDGSEVPTRPASILVISSPNDDLSTQGSFVASGAVDGNVRLSGSVYPWTFGQQADHNWYLSSAADGLLPEISGYAILPSVGRTLGEQGFNLVHDRMSGMREDATPACGRPEEKSRRADAALVDDCHGVWIAATASELKMGANPGFAFSGDAVGLYAGVDAMLSEHDGRTFRGGMFLGYQQGNYWTTGANSTDLPGLGEANVNVGAPAGGLYASTSWNTSSYVDLTLTAQVPHADIQTEDGFRQTITGNSLALSARAGHSFHLSGGWMLEPQLQFAATAMHWGDTVDASDKQLVIDDDVFGTARASLRVERTRLTANGGTIRPWVTVGVQNTVGEKDDALVVPGADGETQPFPAHDVGTSATIDLGVEARLGEGVSLFGAASYGRSVSGSDQEQRSVNVGVRIKW
ncbi:autotransporter-associated beta strand repeat-containing protein [Lysobacter yangpyeongensis]|uniref:Autotransporter-associated beta strand repeat-containing protein n=1 Tax=Lysobacter yangpyeongensis TaxID=346182 RepID=A0ABW0SK74_9GAMM